MPQLQLSHVYPEMECCSCSYSCCGTVMQQYTRNRGSLRRSYVDDGGRTLLCGGRGGGTFFFGGWRVDALPWKTEDGAYPWTGGATLLRVGRMEAESSSVEDRGVPPLWRGQSHDYPPWRTEARRSSLKDRVASILHRR